MIADRSGAHQGEPVTVVVDGSPLQVTAAAPVHVPLRAPTLLLDEPRQPVGCEPRTGGACLDRGRGAGDRPDHRALDRRSLEESSRPASAG